MPIATDNLSKNAMGGTELMKFGLESRLDSELLDNVQIFCSRVHEELSDKHIRVLWLHDLPDDPENNHLANGGWKRFHKLVFCSNWQMRGFISKFNIPWSRCIVLYNAIEPISFTPEDKNKETIRLIYHTTPHRGLQILLPVFQKLKEDYKNVTLDVYSSFKVYGWEQRDEQYKELFDICESTEGITYHGAQPNSVIRDAIKTSHIYSYPNIWEETSCISLIEAMSGGLLSVHPNYGALPETSMNLTHMYHWNEDLNKHAGIFYNVLRNSIDLLINQSEDDYLNKINTQKIIVDSVYNWDFRKVQWEVLLKSLLDLPREIEYNNDVFKYKVGP